MVETEGMFVSEKNEKCVFGLTHTPRAITPLLELDISPRERVAPSSDSPLPTFVLLALENCKSRQFVHYHCPTFDHSDTCDHQT